MNYFSIFGAKQNSDFGKNDVETNVLENVEYIGLQFSSYWCPPCKMLHRKLANVYKEINLKGKIFEIIYLSSDKNEDDYNEFLKHMPWLAVPYNEDFQEELYNKYKISGVPAQVILDRKGKLLSVNAREGIVNQGKEFLNSLKQIP